MMQSENNVQLSMELNTKNVTYNSIPERFRHST